MFIVQIPASSSAVPLTETLLRHSFQRGALEAGRSYEARGRVIALDLSPDSGSIKAQTIGSQPDPYSQALTIRRRPLDGPVIVGRCTCPVATNCKHCAAVAIAAMRRTIRLSTPQGEPNVSAAPPRPAEPEREELPFAIRTWLDELEVTADQEGYPPAVRKRILYIIAPDPTLHGLPSLTIRPFSGTIRKDGAMGALRQYPPGNVAGGAAFLRPSDKVILNRLYLRSMFGSRHSLEEADDTLHRVLATGRAYWMEYDGPPLRLGEPQEGRIEWALGSDLSQHPNLVLAPGLVALRAPAPWYVDPAARLLGPVTAGMPTATAAHLLSAPPIGADVAPRVRAEIAHRLPSLAVPPPRELAPATAVVDVARPHLRLMMGSLPVHATTYRGAVLAESRLVATPVARLLFDYGPVSVPFTTDGKAPRLFQHDGRLYDPCRNLALEDELRDRLEAAGFWHVGTIMPARYRHAHTDDFALMDDDLAAVWCSAMAHEIEELRAEGWRIEIDDDFPFRVLAPHGRVDARLEPSVSSRVGAGKDAQGEAGSGIDWLELHVGVQIDGKECDILPALIRLLREPDLSAKLASGAMKDVITIALGKDKFLALPLARLRGTLEALIELHGAGLVDADATRVGFTRHDAAALAGARATVSWRGGEALRSLGEKLRDAGDAIPRAIVPASFKGTLRTYQAQGVDWLQFLASAGLGGVLADDMGLGKTVQTLAHIVIEKEAGRLDRPALIVCPTSLIPNWRDEAARFAPGLTVLVLHGLGRRNLFDQITSHDLVLTTYPLLGRDHEALTPLDWHMVVLDEAQTIKNPNATTTRQALRLRARQRLCLSGTPLQNHLGELWSLFDFLAPGFLGSQASFRSRYRNPIEKHGDAARSEALARRVRPFLLRRTKEEVATELPPKTEIAERVEMEAGQRAVYEAIRLSMHSRVQAAIAEKGLARSGIIILDALLKMRQACCDPRLLKLPSTQRNKAGSAKLDRLMELLGVMLAEGRRVLLFSQFTEMLGLIERRLAEDSIDHVLLTGDTRDRATPVKRFQAGEVPLFLISLKAGGVGLNLTAADTVIHYDPWWNPAAEDQATDRAHRIGQTRNVFVHRLVTLGTIEEKMELLKEKKRALVASVMEAEHGGALRLTEADVAELFAGA